MAAINFLSLGKGTLIFKQFYDISEDLLYKNVLCHCVSSKQYVIA